MTNFKLNGRKFLLILLLVVPVFAMGQKEVMIKDINIINDGEGRTMGMYVVDKAPIDGSTKIIDGYNSIYIAANFASGKATGNWKIYKDNILTEEATYIDGFQEGKDTEYYDDGKQIKEVQNYTKGKRNGKGTLYFADGKLQAEKEFHDGKLSGTIKEYSSNGKPKSEVGYLNGKQDGPELLYNDEGKLWSSKTYKNGKQVGKYSVTYSSNSGDFTETGVYDDNGKPTGDFSQITVDNTPMKKGQYKDGNKVGVWQYWENDGTLYKNEKYVEGVLVQKSSFYTNGKVKEEISLNKDGRKDGLCTVYTDEGKVKSAVNYLNGRENGKSIVHRTSTDHDYYVTCTYVKGNKEGAYTETFENGKPKVKGQYVKDLQDGTWVTTSYDGKSVKTTKYKMGDEE